MGRYTWYAEGPSNRVYRAKVLKYVAAGGEISAFLRKKGLKRLGKAYQPDPYIRSRVERRAVDLVTQQFEALGYEVDSVARDNVGWDLNALHRYTGARLQLEVKGLSGKEISVELTPNE
jgi:hypothetical protein